MRIPLPEEKEHKIADLEFSIRPPAEPTLAGVENTVAKSAYAILLALSEECSAIAELTPTYYGYSEVEENPLWRLKEAIQTYVSRAITENSLQLAQAYEICHKWGYELAKECAKAYSAAQEQKPASTLLPTTLALCLAYKLNLALGKDAIDVDWLIHDLPPLSGTQDTQNRQIT